MNFAPLLLYAAALVAYAWHFAQRNPPSAGRRRRSSSLER